MILFRQNCGEGFWRGIKIQFHKCCTGGEATRVMARSGSLFPTYIYTLLVRTNLTGGPKFPSLTQVYPPPKSEQPINFSSAAFLLDRPTVEHVCRKFTNNNWS
jgi:hypothetical protein